MDPWWFMRVSSICELYHNLMYLCLDIYIFDRNLRTTINLIPKMHTEVSSAKYLPFCLSLNALNCNSNIFIQENAFEMLSGKCRPFCRSLNVLNKFVHVNIFNAQLNGAFHPLPFTSYFTQ